MRKLSLLSLSGLFVVQFMQAQRLVLLPSAGVQTTLSTVQGSSPVLSSSRQFQTNPTGSFRAYIDNKKGHGLFFGISEVNHGISVKTFDDIYSMGKMGSVYTAPRIELGYQLLTKPIYLNSILDNRFEKNNAKLNRGLFFQLQPMVGLGYNLLGRDGGTGSVGSGTTELKDIISAGNNFSLLTGGNLYIGKNEKQWFFISIMRNWNFGSYSAVAGFNSSYNGNSYQNNITSYGSGTSFSIGIPIRIGGRRSH